MAYSSCPALINSEPNAIEIKIPTPDARPSMPSMRLYALTMPTMVNMVTRELDKTSSSSMPKNTMQSGNAHSAHKKEIAGYQ